MKKKTEDLPPEEARLQRMLRWLAVTEPKRLPVQRFAELAQISPGRARQLLAKYAAQYPALAKLQEEKK